MEDYKNDFVLILAGYNEEMERFLRSNPGLPSRFPIHLAFPNFKLEQLILISESMIKERQYRLSLSATEKLKRHLQKHMQSQDHFGNARYVRNIIEQSIRRQAVRLLQMKYANKDDLMTLRGDDFQFEDTLNSTSVYSWYNK